MAKQIQSFGMTQMTIGACSNFHTTAVKYINEATPAALHIDDKAPAYTDVASLLASIVNRKRAFVSTPQMREADKLRDNATGTISLVINAYIHSAVDECRTAAQLLYQQMSPYRGIGNHEYNKETAEIRGMLAMLAEPENAAAITTLGLSPEVDALREANAAFEEAFDARNDEVSQFSRRRSRSEPPLPGNRTDGERLRHCAAHRRAERLHRQDERLGRLAGKRIGQQCQWKRRTGCAGAGTYGK